MWQYTFYFTRSEFQALKFGEDRGYTGNLLAFAQCTHETKDGDGNEAVFVSLTKENALEWKAQAKSDGEAFGTCLAPCLREKLLNALGEIP